MFCTIINDCQDANAAGRQATRVVSLFGCPTNVIGAQSDLEAAGNLIDVLDATEGRRGVILVNVAPRNGKAKKWTNGTPFGYFWCADTLVVSSIDGCTLSLAEKLGVLQGFRVLETPEEYAKHQFRSFAFLPRAAKDLLDGEILAEGEFDINGIPKTPNAVWWVDNFGNCKTTILPEELHCMAGEIVKTGIGKFRYYESLKDVPDNEIALARGSSGLGEFRFLEIMKQGGSAAADLKLSSGSVVY